jgi:acetylornithine deacetylase
VSLFSDPLLLLSRMASTASESGREQELRDWLLHELRQAGFSAEPVGDGLLARAGGPGPRLLLVSHLDTVPIGQGWIGDPLDGTWHAQADGDRRLVARGANDAKASGAAMLAALAALVAAKRGGRDLPGEVIVALNATEETSNQGMRDLLSAIGQPDGAAVGEPTGLEIVRAQSGLVVLAAHFAGRSCHAAHAGRVLHDNALLAAARALAPLPDVLFLAGEHALLGRSTLVATVLEAGKRHNVVPDASRVVFDGRLAPPFNAGDAERLLAQHLPSARLELCSDRLKPVETSADHPLVLAALEAAGRSQAIGSNTLSDMALLVGVPAVKVGPGQTVRSHTPNEFVLASEVLEGARFYTRFAELALAALAPVAGSARG